MRRFLRIAAVLAVSSFVLCRVFAAAAAGHASMNAYFQSDFTDLVYQKVATEKVIKLWKAPPTNPSVGSKTVVQSLIGRDGKLASVVVTLKSGVKAWDDAALAAVKKAEPFSRLPAGYKGEALQVHWHFAMVP